jgi:CheY-like chemotaxis protein
MASGRRTPILAVTAHDSRHERERCAAADMDDFLTKPVRMGELIVRLALWLGPAPRPDEPSYAERLSAGDLVRLTSFSPLAPLARAPGLCADLREHFQRACRERLERLRRATSAQERTPTDGLDGALGWRRDVFALVTWLGNLGALRLAGLAATLGASRPADRPVVLNLLDRELSALAIS